MTTTHTVETAEAQLTAARATGADTQRLAVLLGELITARNYAARSARIESASTWHGEMGDAEDLAADRAEAAAEEIAAAPILGGRHHR